jgi:hypothetical protein
LQDNRCELNRPVEDRDADHAEIFCAFEKFGPMRFLVPARKRREFSGTFLARAITCSAVICHASALALAGEPRDEFRGNVSKPAISECGLFLALNLPDCVQQ